MTLSAPSAHWLLGHLPALRRDPLGLLAECQGKVVPLRLGRQVHLLLDPVDVCHVLDQSESLYSKGRAFRFGRKLYGNSLLVSESDEHRQQAKQIGSLFYQHAATNFLASAADTTEQWLNRWHDGETLDLWSRLVELTLAISSQAIFGDDYLPHWLGGKKAPVAAEVLAAYDVAMGHVARQNFSLLPMPDWIPTASNRRYSKAIARLNRAFANSVSARRAGQASGGFLDHLLAAHQEDPQGMPISQVRDQSLVLMLGGYESTATALCWTLLLVGANPEIEERVRREIESDSKPWPFLQLVFSESLRLYPPPWLIPRTVVSTDELPSGERLEAGSLVFLSPWRNQRAPEHFADPLVFKPERFLPERIAEIIPGSYFPFGLGPRRCLGESIARTQAELILATMIRRARFRTPTGQLPIPRPLLTLRPTLPLPVEVRFQQ